MLIQYKYQGKSFRLPVNWTSPDGESTIFENIVLHLSQFHELDAALYMEDARKLDRAVDKIFGAIYIMNDEHKAAPFNPVLTKQLAQYKGELQLLLKAFSNSAADESHRLIENLFMSVFNELQKTVGLYLEECKYRSKYETRKRRKETSSEIIPERLMSCEFEDMLLTMTDISRMLDCLTDKEREQLVKHIFLKFTLQEIADSKKTSYQAVQKNIAGALKTLKKILTK